MSSALHRNTSNYTILALSPDKGSGWSVNTTISLVGAIITALPVLFFLWKKVRSLMQPSSSPQPRSASEIEMGYRSPAFPKPPAASPSSVSGHPQAGFELHPINDGHQDQVNTTTYSTQLDASEIQVMQNALPPKETHADVSGAAMLRRASFPTVILQGTIGEEQGRATQASENVSAIVRCDTVP